MRAKIKKKKITVKNSPSVSSATLEKRASRQVCHTSRSQQTQVEATRSQSICLDAFTATGIRGGEINFLGNDGWVWSAIRLQLILQRANIYHAWTRH